VDDEQFAEQYLAMNRSMDRLTVWGTLAMVAVIVLNIWRGWWFVGELLAVCLVVMLAANAIRRHAVAEFRRKRGIQ
jgi:uncharacterized membrane protein